ncbi:copper chaperone PCu(A)C [Suttonella ornithocola]|uniref:Uncharacterized protein conserved in bacteria n=1 Tax=Suttonella ornithocola TaxID=279832 RepID=A0A380MZL7_9GAMM|nr:copper chaperone PCu(A)C [Suttonella ornithocola]SUO97762.1 Uncharacterized protein conserved in bacteria [Suttonella ornithocola]
MMKKLSFLSLALFAGAAMTHENKNTLGDCVIQEVLPGKQMTAAFFTLHHNGHTQKIVGAEIPDVTDHVELHTMKMQDNVMKMEKIDDYTVENGETKFAKGGNHLMLMGVTNSPEVGSKHTITLTFDDGSKAQCEAQVKSVDEILKTAEENTISDSNTQ